MRLINCLIICLIALLIILPVVATHEIEVNEKRIEGCSPNKCLYIIGEQHSIKAYGLDWEEYAVSAEDYEKINYGDKITLEYNSATKLWVVK